MDARSRIEQERRVRCVWLRTKAMYLPLPDAGIPANPVPTAAWWCLRTGAAMGPDGSGACAGDCDRPGRPCYEGPVTL